MLKNRSHSIREGKYWDDVNGGWLDPVLIRKASEEEMQYVKNHAVSEKVPMSQGWKETGQNPIKTGWADTNKISMGQGIQHWTQARLVQRNITSGRSEARHLGGSVKQPEGNSALGDERAKSVLPCEGEVQSLHRASGKETEEDQAVGSVGC